MRNGSRAVKLVWLAALVGMVMSGSVKADAVADFYKGKTLRVVVGFAPGGGYDFYGRIFADNIGRFIPGNPSVITQNMGGGGSLLAAKYLYGVAPKDGTVLGCISQTSAFDNAVAGPSKDLDASKFNYIGRLTDSIDLGLGWPGVAKFKSYEDARKREIVMGATGAASTSYLLPAALNKHGGARFKIVVGYKGSNEILLAAERGEVEAVGSMNLAVIVTRYPKWVHDKQGAIMYQGGIRRHPFLPDVPSLPELGITAEDKQVLTAISGAAEIGRAINAPPDIPKDRLNALRRAFDAMMKDKDFLADMAKRKALISYMSGEEVDKIAQGLAQMPKRTIELAKALIPANK
jgi:tripartite-type tricarboxylate transporter receptor subunit TctC